MDSTLLETTHHHFIKLELSKHATTNSFDWFSNHIQRKSIIVIAKNFISNLTTSLSARELLAIYIIAYYPDISLSGDRNELEIAVYDTSTHLVSIIDTYPIDPEVMTDSFNKFQVIFTIWKNKDKEALIKHLSKTQTQIIQLNDYIKTLDEPSYPTSDIMDTIQKLKNSSHTLGDIM